MVYKVVAFDLDGTLLTSEGNILPQNKRAIAKIREQGIKVLLVTGRHHTTAKPYFLELQLDTPIICCNGSYLYDVKLDTMPIANPLSKLQAEKIIRLTEEKGVHLLMYNRDAMNYKILNPHLEKLSHWVNTYPIDIRPKLRQIDDFHDALNQEQIIWKFVISHPERQRIQQIADELPDSEFSCEWSWSDRMDIANYGNSKGNCLLALLTQWNIKPEEVMVFGDNYNDISMLNAAGLSVAMGNADAEIKQQAKLVTHDHNQPGIAEILARYYRLQ